MMKLLPELSFLISFYDCYNQPFTLSRKIKKALEKENDTEEPRANKYLASKYFEFQMRYGRSAVAQSHELQKIVHEIQSEEIKIDDQMQMATITDKLSIL